MFSIFPYTAPANWWCSFQTLRIYLQYTMAIFVRTATSFQRNFGGCGWVDIPDGYPQIPWFIRFFPYEPWRLRRIYLIFRHTHMVIPQLGPFFQSSSKEIKPILSLSTAHRHNIFDAHLTGRQVVSCGADGFVCRTYLDASWQERLFTPNVETTPLAFKMDFLPQSQVFLVTFGDGFVRQFDLRVATQLAAVNCDDVGLVGLGVEPRDGHTLALGGNDPFLRIYDLRKLSFHQESNLMNMITTPVVSLHSTAEMIQKHKKIISFSRFFSGHSDVCISGVCWDSCGRLLANYRGGDIELFDFRSDPVPEGDAPEATPWMDLSDSSLPTSPTSRVYLNSIRSYKGRINEQTCAKEVRFLCQGAAVASGGDCGHFYIWSTESTVPWSQI